MGQVGVDEQPPVGVRVPTPPPAPINPATLRPSESLDTGSGPVTRGIGGNFQGDAPALTDNYTTLNGLWNDYLQSQLAKGVKVTRDPKTGVVEVAQPASSGLNENSFSVRMWLADPKNAGKTAQDAIAALDDSGGNSKDVWQKLGDQDPIQQLSYSLSQAEADAKKAAAGGALGSAQSYLASEKAKQSEVTRQLNDFEDRANEVHKLQDEEQQYGMRAADANAKTAANIAKGFSPVAGTSGWFMGSRPSATYSDILAPSVERYVLPDYQTNGAVGLPGGDGFMNYQGNDYTPNASPQIPGGFGISPQGSPSFAQGTVGGGDAAEVLARFKAIIGANAAPKYATGTVDPALAAVGGEAPPDPTPALPTLPTRRMSFASVPSTGVKNHFGARRPRISLAARRVR